MEQAQPIDPIFRKAREKLEDVRAYHDTETPSAVQTGGSTTTSGGSTNSPPEAEAANPQRSSCLIGISSKKSDPKQESSVSVKTETTPKKEEPQELEDIKKAPMIAVIFEAWPKAEHRELYFDFAAELKPILQEIDGFISVERFESLTEKGKFLSLSFFRDEAAVEAWRNTVEHRRTQAKGRARIFENYRLRVASVMRDYGLTERDQAPKDSRAVHEAKLEQ